MTAASSPPAASPPPRQPGRRDMSVTRPADTDGAAEDDGTVRPGRGGLIMTGTAPSAPTVMMARVAVGHSLMWARLALALSGITEPSRACPGGRSREDGLRGGRCAFGRLHAGALAWMTPALDPACARSRWAGAGARGAPVWLPR